jgi:hypothetical protein
MSWESWLSEKSEAKLEVTDGQILVDPATFEPFVIVRVRMNLTPEMESEGHEACVDYAKRMIEEKLK